MEQNQKPNIMNQNFKLWQGGVAFLIMLATMIYNWGSANTTTINRINVLERQFSEFKEEQKKQNDKTGEKIDKVDSKVTDILIILQNKQDRK